MFDYINVKYPLPLEDANDLGYQTKNTPSQLLDYYEIREDGTLWHQNYDIEDHSDPNAEGIARIFGMLTRVNERWEPVPDFTGEIVFYHVTKSKWLEWSSYFENGHLVRLNLLKNK